MTDQYQLRDRYTADAATVFLTGIQALARLPIEQLRADQRAGHNTAAFVSGYQGSPLGGYGEEAGRAAKHAPEFEMVVRPALNEEAAATAVMGSQVAVNQPDCRYDGIVGIWYGKAPGVDRAADALRHAVFTGTSMMGGAVALVGDDPASKSSTLPSSSAGVLADLHMPLLYPGDPGEALDLGRHAIAMSRATGLWSALKIVADVADGTASIELDPDRVRPVIPEIDGVRYHHSPDGRLLPPHNLEVEREILTVRYELALRYAAENRLNHTVVNPADAWLGIVASGITYREVREAMARLGLATDSEIAAAGVRILKMGMPLPFNAATVRDFADGLDQVMVIEEKQPNVESLVKDALYDLAVRPAVTGKVDQQGQPLFPVYGALDADTLRPLLHRQLVDRLGDRLAPPVKSRERELIPLRVQRSPFFCSGCPHNRSTEVPDGSLVGAGIGCHTMTLYMEEERVGEYTGVTCMGSEGGQWWGMADFLERDHYIQNLGDGTYFHSGQLAIQGAIAAGVNMTYKLLYNGTVAMTGGQDPKGQLAPADVATVLLTQGASRVLITADDPDRYRGVSLPKGVDVWHRDRLIEAQEELAQVKGVTVLIHDQACAAEARRDRKRGLVATPTQRVVINHRICEGCGDCGQVSNCLSVQPLDTPFGRKTKIDQTTCNLDYSCLDGDCPSFMTIELEPDPDAPEADSGGLLSRLGPLTRKATSRLGSGSSSTGGQDRTGLTERLRRRRSARHAEADALDSLDDSDALNTFTLNTTPSIELGDPPAGALPHPVLVVPAEDFAMRVTGIGGTGVVTVAQVLGTAAMLDGFHVRGLDQIGLSQKAGPVVSDVRLSTSAPAATNRLGDAQADLLLAFDQLTAASPRGMLTADPQRTAVVGSTSPVPTGEMITRPDLSMPSPEELVGYIADHTRADQQHWADAQQLTKALFGQATTANMFVVGMAVQAGALPIGSERIEEAIALNGVAVEANQLAFRWGRALITDPELVHRTAEAAHRGRSRESTDGGTAPIPGVPGSIALRIDQLHELVATDTERLTMFASELIEWGDTSDAEGWLDVVERVARSERQLEPDQMGRLTEAVAANLYKLIAYKDEYEVARLMTDPDGLAAARAVAGESGTVAWKLHPPMLRALGMDSKITIGSWAEPGIRTLAKGKRLRGTPADPFGRAEVRKVERQLPGEFIKAVDRALAALSADTYATAVGLAELPDLVRGYEDIKLANVAIYREALAIALADLR